MIILGVHEGHDAGAALLRDGKIIAAVNEERIVREKLFTGVPKQSIKEVLKLANVQPHQVDRVAVAGTLGVMASLGWTDINFKKKLYQAAAKYSLLPGTLAFANAQRMIFRPFRNKLVQDYVRSIGIDAPISYVDHHRCHAASAYYTSGKPECLVITSDGSGDGMSASVYIGKDNDLRLIKEFPSYHSTAYYYAYVTLLLGFKMFRHEGKITGLAAHGDPYKHYPVFKDCFGYSNGSPVNKLGLMGQDAIAYLRKRLEGANRDNVAAAVQKRTEDVMQAFVADYIQKTGIGDVAVAGGIFSNVKLNQRIAEQPITDSFFVYPHMGDGGIATGAALYVSSQLMLNKGSGLKSVRLNDVYFGTSYNNEEIEVAIAKHKLKGEKVKNIEKFIAEKVAKKKVVGHFDGKMEYGPRALGNRSVLADPTDKNINDWLNKRMHRCYDERTEILTNDGWKLIKDLADDEVVATLNPKNNQLEYQKIENKISYEFKGEMYSIKNNRIDLLVTPQHNFWIKKKHGKKFEFRSIEDLYNIKTYHYQKIGGVNWKSKINMNYFVLPGITHLNKRKKENIKIPINLWLEFLGYYLSEGSIYYDGYGHYKVGVAQSKKSKNYKCIEVCIKKMHFNSFYNVREFIILNKQLYTYLKKFGKAKDKHIPQELLKLPKDKLKILFDALIKGDGNIRGSGYRYATTSKRLAGNVQELAIKLGFSARISVQKALKKQHNDLYMVRIGRSSVSTVRKYQITKQSYNGQVYCVTVPNHMIFVRRNGKPVFCGNSEFMPFAPSIIDRAAPDYFNRYEKSPYPAEFMTITFDCTKRAQKAEAVVHVDNTARPQVVSEKQNPRYYKILNYYEKETGLPLFVNTSFNIHEEPIVRSPEDAIRSFLKGMVDVLVMGNWVVEA